jgi:hypothetical protein
MAWTMTINTDDLAKTADAFSKKAKTTAIYLARIGVDGTSGNHLYRKTLLELHLMNAALDAIKQLHTFEGFHLAGQSGGSKLVAGLAGMRRDIGCAVAGSGPLVLIQPADSKIPGRTLFDPVEFIPPIVKNSALRLLVVTDPADQNVPVKQQTGFVEKLHRAGRDIPQFFVTAVDDNHHGVLAYTELVTAGCILGKSDSEIVTAIRTIECPKKRGWRPAHCARSLLHLVVERATSLAEGAGMACGRCGAMIEGLSRCDPIFGQRCNFLPSSWAVGAWKTQTQRPFIRPNGATSQNRWRLPGENGNEASARVVVSRRFDWIAASIGRIAFLSSMKSPRWLSSSSPIGVSSESRATSVFQPRAESLDTRLSQRGSSFAVGLFLFRCLARLFGGLLGLGFLDDVDAHLAEHREDVLDLLGIDLFRQRVDLVMGDVAMLPGGADQRLHGPVRPVEQGAVRRGLGTLLLQTRKWRRAPTIRVSLAVSNKSQFRKDHRSN